MDVQSMETAEGHHDIGNVLDRARVDFIDVARRLLALRIVLNHTPAILTEKTRITAPQYQDGILVLLSSNTVTA